MSNYEVKITLKIKIGLEIIINITVNSGLFKVQTRPFRQLEPAVLAVLYKQRLKTAKWDSTSIESAPSREILVKYNDRRLYLYTEDDFFLFKF